MDSKAEKTSVQLSLADGQNAVPRYIFQDISTEINSDTPKFIFPSLDNLLQRQFYKLCSPVLLRQLSLSSRMMNRISCPSTYVSYYTRFYGPSIQVYVYTEVPDQTAVIEIRDELNLTCLNPGDISKYIEKYVFHHNKIKLDNSLLNAHEFKIIFNPNVTNLQCFIPSLPKSQSFTSILERMPNLEYLKYETYEEVSDLPLALFDWKQNSQLKEVEFKGFPDTYINNFLLYPDLLSLFIKRQERSFKMFLHINNANVESGLLEYFYIIDDIPKEDRCLILRGYPPSKSYILKTKEDA